MPEINRSIPGRPRIILIIYLVFFCFFSYKVIFYSNYVGRFPDEPAHISYIAYLEATHKVIPDFKEMTILIQKSIPAVNTGSMSDRQGYGGTFAFSGSTNYLGHPPLYYQIMRLSGGIQVHGGIVTIDIVRLRGFSWLLAALALLLIFYIGYSRLGNNPSLHLLYAVICVSVPMLAYDSAGINNDTLSLLGISIYIFGMIRFAEGKHNLYTFVLISTGFAISFFAKLTAGMIIVISTFVFLLFYLFREKNLRFLLSRQFLVTIPLYAVIIAYFLSIHAQTGAFQPSLDLLNHEQYLKSGFFIQPADRTNMDSARYIRYYISKFTGSWTGIASHVELLKNEHIYSLGRIGLNLLWILPLMVLYPFYKTKQFLFVDILLFTIYLSLVITALTQFTSAYNGYKDSGYLGGFQSRYYLCATAAFALATTLGIKKIFCLDSYQQINELPAARYWIKSQMPANLNLKNFITNGFLQYVGGNAICVLFSVLLIYEDFIYFVLHFKQYL